MPPVNYYALPSPPPTHPSWFSCFGQYSRRVEPGLHSFCSHQIHAESKQSNSLTYPFMSDPSFWVTHIVPTCECSVLVTIYCYSSLSPFIISGLVSMLSSTHRMSSQFLFTKPLLFPPNPSYRLLPINCSRTLLKEARLFLSYINFPVHPDFFACILLLI